MQEVKRVGVASGEELVPEEEEKVVVVFTREEVEASHER